MGSHDLSGNREPEASAARTIVGTPALLEFVENGLELVERDPDSAVAHSMMRMHGTNAAGPFDDQVMTMHLWVKSNGKWLLAAHQTTKVK